MKSAKRKGVRQLDSKNDPSSPNRKPHYEPEVLLVERKDGARMLNKSIPSMIRYEKMGLLKPIKFSGRRGEKVHYTIENIRRVASGEPSNPEEAGDAQR